jgi:hypothetical protein
MQTRHMHVHLKVKLIMRCNFVLYFLCGGRDRSRVKNGGPKQRKKNGEDRN